MAVRVGDRGRALSPMAPSGAVELAGVRHDARSDGRFVPAGAEVEVVRADPTGFVVRPVEAGAAPLPDHGRELIRAEFQRNSADIAEVEARELAELWRRHVKRVAATAVVAELFGVFIGLFTFVVLAGSKTFHHEVADQEGPVFIGTVLVGGTWPGAIILSAACASWRHDRGAWFAPTFAVAGGVIAPAVTFVQCYQSHPSGPLSGWVMLAAAAGAVGGWLVDRLIVFLCTVLVNAD